MCLEDVPKHSAARLGALHARVALLDDDCSSRGCRSFALCCALARCSPSPPTVPWWGADAPPTRPLQAPAATRFAWPVSTATFRTAWETGAYPCGARCRVAGAACLAWVRALCWTRQLRSSWTRWVGRSWLGFASARTRAPSRVRRGVGMRCIERGWLNDGGGSTGAATRPPPLDPTNEAAASSRGKGGPTSWVTGMTTAAGGAAAGAARGAFLVPPPGLLGASGAPGRRRACAGMPAGRW